MMTGGRRLRCTAEAEAAVQQQDMGMLDGGRVDGGAAGRGRRGCARVAPEQDGSGTGGGHRRSATADDEGCSQESRARGERWGETMETRSGTRRRREEQEEVDEATQNSRTPSGRRGLDSTGLYWSLLRLVGSYCRPQVDTSALMRLGQLVNKALPNVSN